MTAEPGQLLLPACWVRRVALLRLVPEAGWLAGCAAARCARRRRRLTGEFAGLRCRAPCTPGLDLDLGLVFEYYIDLVVYFEYVDARSTIYYM